MTNNKEKQQQFIKKIAYTLLNNESLLTHILYNQKLCNDFNNRIKSRDKLRLLKKQAYYKRIPQQDLINAIKHAIPHLNRIKLYLYNGKFTFRITPPSIRSIQRYAKRNQNIIYDKILNLKKRITPWYVFCIKKICDKRALYKKIDNYIYNISTVMKM